MAKYKKRDFPVEEIRRFLEPGPIVLVSSEHHGKRDIMSMGWHMPMEFSPSLIGCIISNGNSSFDLIRKSEECVINIPESHLLRTLVGIGNQHGGDKFAQFKLTPAESSEVKAPGIEECYAHFECKLEDGKLIDKYNFFVWRVVKAVAAIRPKYPHTVHYTGDGTFMLSGPHRNLSRFFKKENL